MTTEHKYAPAFPIKIENRSYEEIDGFYGDKVQANTEVVYRGITIRDYFAAKVLQGFMVRADGVNDLDDEYLIETSMTCYRMADAMLAAREK